jgi:hypothetical protein
VAIKPALKQPFYEIDFALCLDEQASALKGRRSVALNWYNQAEEIEGLARRSSGFKKLLVQRVIAHALTFILGYWWKRNG